jgi:hypothetical protein
MKQEAGSVQQEPINVNEYIRGNITLDELTDQFSDRIKRLILEHEKINVKLNIIKIKEHKSDFS